MRVRLLAVLVVGVLASLPAWAGRVSTSASGRGTFGTPCGSPDPPCEAVVAASFPGAVTISGSASLAGEATFNSDGSVVEDLFKFTGVTSDDKITLNLKPGPGNFGAWYCGDVSSDLSDWLASGFCTNIDPSTGDSFLNSGTTSTFTFTIPVGVDASTWVLYADPSLVGGSTTTVPEPGSMILFGSGLMGIASGIRKRFRK